MSQLKLRLALAAAVASISISSNAQAQIDLNDSNPSGVIVSLRPQSGYFVTLDGAKATSKDDTAKAKDEQENSDAKAADEKDASQAEDKKDEEKKAEQDKEDAKAARPNESGRLSPITMESVRAPIGAANIAVIDIGTKVLPEDQAAKQMTPRIPLPGGRDRALSGLTYRWQAANICHFPLYFEEPMLERHGQQCCPTWIQPAVSGSKFLSNLILYPYKATLHPAFENRYTLGHFRPGSGAPCLRDTLPWSADAALVQAGATTAVFVGLPW